MKLLFCAIFLFFIMIDVASIRRAVERMEAAQAPQIAR
jgi:hypothetical protein